MKKFASYLAVIGFTMPAYGAEVPQYLKDVADRPITPEYCATLKGHLLAEFVYSRLLYKMALASNNDAKGEAIVLPKLTKPLRTFYHFRTADALIGNGGLWAYFGLGDYPRYEKETIAAFRTFGLEEVANILEETSVIHKLENKKFEAAKKDGREDEFITAYGFTAYDALEARLWKIGWDFVKVTERYLRKHITDLKEVSALAQSADTAAVHAFFKEYVELSDAYNTEIANLYSDSAVIRTYRRYPHGLERSMELSGSRWKMVLVKAMPLAKAQADRSTYSNIEVSIAGSKAKIKADRYSARKCYLDKGYYMVIERQPNSAYLIVEEYSETQPQSSC